jgi:hypothetical protein
MSLRIGLLLFMIGALCGTIITCNCGKPSKGYYSDGKPDTAYIVRWKTHHTRDTEYIPKPVISYVPQPYIPNGWVRSDDIKEPLPDTQFGEHDSLYILHLLAVREDYFTKYLYKDSILTPYATIYIEDTLYRNRIASRKPLVVTNIPTTTISVSKTQPKRTMFYAGGIVSFTTDYQGGSIGVGGSASLKFKNDVIVGIGATINTYGQKQYLFRTEAPIRLRRKK